ncbi:39S ribosomal protein L41, mitochondrial-like [Centruroides sculpturatus]|uniref:39S ribosomal protein L41, mitochondrial-like n=1 Tax=Centruroides sculpturatus TaxID=218467 RepID=UPI000C6D95E8|nr:39S ribosomal protein L41, mitochondrial-like [Centruroides sculpturatus]
MAANMCFLIQTRRFSITQLVNGKRNFKNFYFPNKRGPKQYRENLRKNNLVDHRGLRVSYLHFPNGEKLEKKYFPELFPELIVPDLTDCKLKPYVSYQAPEVTQSEFTAKDLFDAVYSKKIMDDFKSGKLDSDGNPLEPSEEESLTPEEARIRARKSGSDIFGFNPIC